MYALTSAINGVPNVGYVRVISATSLNNETCVAWLDTDTEQPGWQVITEAEYNALIKPEEME